MHPLGNVYPQKPVLVLHKTLGGAIVEKNFFWHPGFEGARKWYRSFRPSVNSEEDTQVIPHGSEVHPRTVSALRQTVRLFEQPFLELFQELRWGVARVLLG
jgi:hypothetical protein